MEQNVDGITTGKTARRHLQVMNVGTKHYQILFYVEIEMDFLVQQQFGQWRTILFSHYLGTLGKTVSIRCLKDKMSLSN